MDVVSLLESKNRVLKKFLDASLDFLSRAEGGDFSELQDFHTWRDAALRALDLYDRKILEEVAHLTPADKGEALARRVENALQLKESLLHDILVADGKIIAQIETEKSRVSRQISASEKAKTNMNKFKSTWIAESGEELDKKL